MATITTPFTAGSAANSASLAATIAAAAGDVLFAYTWQYSTANVVNSITDSLGGTWVKAFGPIQGPAGSSNAKLYGWYKLNAAAGSTVVTAAWSGAAQGLTIVGKISGLGGGGALDQQVSNIAYTAGSFLLTAGAFAAFPASGAAIVGVAISSNAPTPVTGWTGSGNFDTYNYERGISRVTTTSAALTPTWDVGSTPSFVAGAMSFTDAAVPATLSGNVTLDKVAPGGGLSSVAASLSGNVAVDDLTTAGGLSSVASAITGNVNLEDTAVSGAMGAAPGRIRLLGANDEWRNKAGTLLASKACTVDVHAVGGAQLARIATATDSAGLIPEISHSALSQSTLYRVDILFGTGEYGVVYRSSEAT